jgi:serine protease Do
MRNVLSARSLAAASALAIALVAPSFARAAGPLPALPGEAPARAPATAPAAPAAAESSGGASAGNAAPGAAASAPTNPLERVRRGIVLVEREGRLVGFGTVLDGDGRVLTALSAIGAGDTADVRYADGTVVRAKVGHKDASWDLALLVPRAVHWKDGLSASPTDPSQSELRAPIPTRAGAKPIALPVHFKGRTDALSRAGDSLMDALDIEVHHALPIAGAPILDPQASVVGVLVRACTLTTATGAEAAKNGPIGCAPTLIGAPVSALRTFLSKTPANAGAPTPWLGIAGEPDDTGAAHGVRVLAIAPQSPAQKAGLKSAESGGTADRILAVDGQPVDSPEKLADAIAKHAVGDTVKLLLLSSGGAAGAAQAPSFREVSVVLKAAPAP